VTECLEHDGLLVEGCATPEAAHFATVRSVHELTPRQCEAARALATCETTAEIAALLYVEEESASDRLQHLARRLGVHSRHRLFVRLLQYGLLRPKPRPAAPGQLHPTLDVEETALVLRVSAAYPEDRTRVRVCLQAGGHNVMEGAKRPYVVRLVEGPADLRFTAGERRVVEKLLRHDHSKAIAKALRISPSTVRDQLQRVMETADAHSREWLLVRLAAYGYLTVEACS